VIELSLLKKRTPSKGVRLQDGLVGLSDPNTNNYKRIIQYKNNCNARYGKLQEANCNFNGSERQYPQYEDQSVIKNVIRQYPKRLSEDEIQAVISGYQGGATVYKLAEQFNCNRNTISSHLKRNGIQPTIKKFTTQTEVDELISLYAKGLKIDEIAKQYNVGASTVRVMLCNNGVKMRTRWDYQASFG
jgi:DNA-binding NarL/FixJ family response regulator